MQWTKGHVLVKKNVQVVQNMVKSFSGHELLLKKTDDGDDGDGDVGE